MTSQTFFRYSNAKLTFLRRMFSNLNCVYEIVSSGLFLRHYDEFRTRDDLVSSLSLLNPCLLILSCRRRLISRRNELCGGARRVPPAAGCGDRAGPLGACVTLHRHLRGGAALPPSALRCLPCLQSARDGVLDSHGVHSGCGSRVLAVGC